MDEKKNGDEENPTPLEGKIARDVVAKPLFPNDALASKKRKRFPGERR